MSTDRNDEFLDDPARIERLAALGAKAEREMAILEDRTKWGPGPWENEPDRAEWRTAAGLPGLAVRGPYGNWCGYAAVAPGHPAHGAAFGKLDINAHGGLTYGQACQGEICHVPTPGEPDDVWWLGFDCGHAGDVMPGMNALMRATGCTASLEFMGEPHAHYRTLEYVRAEVEDLAAQLVALTETE